MHLERPLVFKFKLFFLLFFFYFFVIFLKFKLEFGPGIKQTRITHEIVQDSPVALVVPNPSVAGFMASRESVITRAVALGPGAATTGFKRFLALTEASKYRKDGPFRKLFHP
ncbi:hypothetical protein HN873_067791 [Arachis hypogaea]|uniref:Uncharacterized protein n=1 Tax=Arachis hypogaea TaxID=3818 RepID=A0A444XQQ6_ARAHY|nr:hypothetical protein Ahy_B09g098145 [Arachis hypogaea]